MRRDKWWMLGSGVLIGLLAVWLVKMGNPPNMGFCIACFERDIAGARAPLVQYLRPEIVGIVLGALLTSLVSREYQSRGGSNTFVRFMLGVFMMIGALVFLGCPLRDILRMAGGDFNAVVAFAGFAVGVAVGVWFLRGGFNLGAERVSHSSLGGFMLPLVLLFFLSLLVTGTVFNPDAGGPLFFSKEGPGSMHAAVGLSLAAGLLVGFLAQRTRLCLSGGIRDFLIMRDTHLLLGFLGILLGALALNLSYGFFHPGFANQPVAHTAHLWNFLGLGLVGLCATLLGGCPLRQLVLAGTGDTDAAAVVVGMMVGAGFSHNFMFAASPAGVGIYSQLACVVGWVVVALIGWSYRQE
ncbi:MAG: YedE family putative selenium transporter [Syntrophomonadaceae bacterium]|nr:YedE family putative selenium transporter [Syntrophomonadaceae bacterium]